MSIFYHSFKKFFSIDKYLNIVLNKRNSKQVGYYAFCEDEGGAIVLYGLPESPLILRVTHHQ